MAIGDFLAFLEPGSNALELELREPIDLAAAQRAAGALHANATLQQLTLTKSQLDADGCKALAPGIAAVQQLQKLRINYSARMGVEGVEHLMNAVASKLELREFHFGDNGLETEGWLIVCRSLENHPGIQHLDLSWALSESVIGEAAEACGAALAQLLRRNQVLEALLLTEDHLGTEAVIQVADAVSTHPSLTRLELNYNEMKDEGAAALAKMLRSNRKLEILCLHANCIGAIGLEALCNALTENQSLRSIDLRHNACGDIGAPLGEALRHSRVESWDLRYMQLGLASFMAIAERLGPSVKDLYFGEHDPLPLECLRNLATVKGSNLESLKMDLSQQLPDSVVIDLVQCLQNNLSLRDFCFNQDGPSCPEVCRRQFKAIIAGSALEEVKAQRLEDDDVQLLAKAKAVSSTWTTLRCQPTPSSLTSLLELLEAPCSLKVLDLSSTQLSGCGALSQLMKIHLEELSVSNCGLSEADMSDLTSPLATESTLERLDLSRNPLQGGAKAVATALASNRSLKWLNLQEVGLDNESFNALAGSLQQNHSLQELIFSGQVDDASHLAEALQVSSLRALISMGDLFAGAQAQLLASALETNCCLRRLELEHVTPKKLKKDEAYRSAMKKIETQQHDSLLRNCWTCAGAEAFADEEARSAEGGGRPKQKRKRAGCFKSVEELALIFVTLTKAHASAQQKQKKFQFGHHLPKMQMSSGPAESDQKSFSQRVCLQQPQCMRQFEAGDASIPLPVNRILQEVPACACRISCTKRSSHHDLKAASKLLSKVCIEMPEFPKKAFFPARLQKSSKNRQKSASPARWLRLRLQPWTCWQSSSP